MVERLIIAWFEDLRTHSTREQVREQFLVVAELLLLGPVGHVVRRGRMED